MILDVTNRSSSRCSFSLGEYVRNLDVAPGAQAEIGFTVIDVYGDISPDATTMGCANDDHRRGTLELPDSTAR